MGRIAKWRLLSEEEFAKLVKESRSFNELAKKIGYAENSGGTFITLQAAIKERNLDISHFTGQSWKKEDYNYSNFRENNLKKKW